MAAAIIPPLPQACSDARTHITHGKQVEACGFKGRGGDSHNTWDEGGTVPSGGWQDEGKKGWCPWQERREEVVCCTVTHVDAEEPRDEHSELCELERRRR